MQFDLFPELPSFATLMEKGVMLLQPRESQPVPDSALLDHIRQLMHENAAQIRRDHEILFGHRKVPNEIVENNAA